MLIAVLNSNHQIQQVSKSHMIVRVRALNLCDCESVRLCSCRCRFVTVALFECSCVVLTIEMSSVHITSLHRRKLPNKHLYSNIVFKPFVLLNLSVICAINEQFLDKTVAYQCYFQFIFFILLFLSVSLWNKIKRKT